MKYLYIFLLFTPKLIFSQKAVLGAEKIGKCSYYHKKFEGRKTYFGQIYKSDSLTAAHRTLPANTIVAITNTETQHTVIVKINDRGPYAHGRLIDVSDAAAIKLGLKKKGTATVTVKVIGFNGFQNLLPIDPPDTTAEYRNSKNIYQN